MWYLNWMKIFTLKNKCKILYNYYISLKIIWVYNLRIWTLRFSANSSWFNEIAIMLGLLKIILKSSCTIDLRKRREQEREMKEEEKKLAEREQARESFPSYEM